MIYNNAVALFQTFFGSSPPVLVYKQLNRAPMAPPMAKYSQTKPKDSCSCRTDAAKGVGYGVASILNPCGAAGGVAPPPLSTEHPIRVVESTRLSQSRYCDDDTPSFM